MHNLRCNGYPGLKAKDRQIVRQKPRAARNMCTRELRAIGRFTLIGAPQVADVVKKTGDDADDRAFRAQALLQRLLPLIAYDQARERERDVEGVLAVVIDGIDAEVAGHEPREQLFKVVESMLQRMQGRRGPGWPEKRFDSREHRRCGAHLHGVGDVEIAASCAGHLIRPGAAAGGRLPQYHSRV